MPIAASVGLRQLVADRSMVRILSVVDAYTRECLALEAVSSLGSGRVTRVCSRY